MSPGVPGNEGERYQRRRGPVRPPGGDPSTSRRSLSSTWTLGPGARAPGAAGRVPVGEESGRCDGQRQCIAAGSTGVPGRVQRGRRRTAEAPAGRPPRPRPAEVSLALADGSADVSPIAPLEISVTDGELAEVTRRRRRRHRRCAGAVAAAPGDTGPDVWTPEAPAGLRHQLHAHRDGDERRRRGGRRRPRRSPPSPRPRSPRRRSARSTGRPSASACRSASTSTTRSPTRPPSRATCVVTSSTPTDGVVELVQRHRGALPAVAVLAGRTSR